MTDLDFPLFGSDHPHAEGLAEPRDFAERLAGLDAAEVRQIMSGNARELVAGAA